MNRVLMIAFHYPPVQGSSGVHRTVNFSRYLPDHGWKPVVLTATLGAYPSIDVTQLGRIPTTIPVERAVAFDTGRHLAIRGVYPKWLSLPDRWVSWWPAAVTKGLALIRRHRPNVIWSTFPIATAHLIAHSLSRMTGIPWVADFRDPMTEINPVTGDQFPADPLRRRVYGWIEQRSLLRCAAAVFTTPGAIEMYSVRFGDTLRARSVLIQNGFDEESFRTAECTPTRPSTAPRRAILLHSGVLYPDSRNPRCFFEALAQLRRSGAVCRARLKVLLRGSGNQTEHRSELRRLGIDDLVSLESAIPYENALAEMLSADGLLIFQGSDSNRQIPAKVYEYLRARRPILAFVDPAGDTAKLLKCEGIQNLACIDSTPAIASALLDFLERLNRGALPLPSAEQVERHSRRFRTGELASLLNSVADKAKPVPQRPTRPVSQRSS